MENSSESPTKPDSNSVDAINHLVQGKRHLLVRDYASAVSSLQEACKLLAEKYGETADECGEAYFYYGKALLELSRLENGVLGNALQGVPDDDDDEGDEKDSDDSAVENPETVTGEEHAKIKQQVAEALEENCHELDKISAKLASTVLHVDKTDANIAANSGAGASVGDHAVVFEETPGDAEGTESEHDDAHDEDSESKEESEDKSEDIEDESEKEEAAKAQDSSNVSTEPGPSKAQDPGNQEEEEISNLELAWEILELAKVIFKRQAETNQDLQLKITEVLMKLGEVSIESDNYPQAIDDLSECLNMRLELLPVDDRLIADVYYQLGLAYSLSNAFDSAIEHFSKAIDVIQLRIDNHKKLTEGKPKENGFMSDDPVEKAREEIRELESIIPEIRSKIEDTQDLKRNMHLSAEERLSVSELCHAPEGTSLMSEKEQQSPSKPVSNITHLVKRKSKRDDEAPSLEAKRFKPLEQGDEDVGISTSQEKASKKDSPSSSSIAQQNLPTS